MRRRLVSAQRVLGALGLAALCGWSTAAPLAMTLELPKLDGTAFVRLDDYAGRPVLLNFWGSECPPCVAEMPLLFAQALRQPGLQFIGIAIDQRAAATRFLARFQPTYPQLIAPANGEVLLRRFGNKRGALPFTVVVNDQHRICMTQSGEVDAAWIAAAVSHCSRATSQQQRP